MSKISLPIEEIKEHYDVVVIGSGYGGGIAASRLSRAGRKVCMLERGREIRPGQYPNTLVKATEEMQMHLPNAHVGSETGMFDFHVNKEQNALVGCGLGGTSLINANVSIEPEPEVFDDPSWPKAVREHKSTRLKEGYDRAREMLKPNPTPDKPNLPKTDAHKKSGEYMGADWYKVNINVTFEDPEGGVNHVGEEQAACNNCGDCVSGCNYKAKNTTLMNYLPDAFNHGTEIFCEAGVDYIEKDGDQWLVHFQPQGMGRAKFNAPEMVVRADLVVVAAGTLGTAGIMMRSRDKGLSVSGRLGEDFTGNGDILGFGYNCDQEVNGVGWGDRPEGEIPPVGPCITSVIDMREGDDWTSRMILEEGSIPGAIGSILPVAMSAAAKLGKDTDSGIADAIKEGLRKADAALRGPYHGAIKNTQTYLIMSHDNAKGRLLLDEKGNVRISWPGVGTQPNFIKGNDKLYKATEALGGTFVPNPIWNKLMHHSIVTVHPLGGCIMAEDAGAGVVNHKGQVFSGDSGEDVYDSLYISDGAVLPTSLACNPLFTICAVAERNMRILCEDRNWSLSYALPSSTTRVRRESTLGIRFTETMKGFFSTRYHQPESTDFPLYEQAARQGEQDNSPLEFTLTITGEDLDDMISNPNHPGRIMGTLTAPALDPEPLTVADGNFNLFVDVPDKPGTKHMNYKMKLTSNSGKNWFFSGFKSVQDDHSKPDVTEIWKDTSTLYITVYEGEDQTGAVVGKGVLHIKVADFAKQMTTMEVINAGGLIEEGKAIARFGAYFAGSLWGTYGPKM